ncbi:MAG: barstar family protein [Planctomycetales bacterium]
MRRGAEGSVASGVCERAAVSGIFRGNWDAFEECLRDLSWLPKGSVVRIVHEGHPFRIDSGELRTYLEILQGAASGAGENTIKVRVQFSRRHQRALERVLSG